MERSTSQSRLLVTTLEAQVLLMRRLKGLATELIVDEHLQMELQRLVSQQ